ncbi:uncharacterized protein LOC125681451 isoform X2 [Ostrea edulis]|uniref:uncharacterized protein LOC125681451 isoform X2 n=1 Tax=Ostrea edulis TaxID=37623 RepID=UPI0020946A1B|nr:uncharacterized protein LOC125681451 isoform X2 [Ostrea edulis]
MTNNENHGVLPPILQRQPRPVTRKRREPPTQFHQPPGEEQSANRKSLRRGSDIRDSSPRTSLLWNRRQESPRHVFLRRPETKNTTFRPRTANFTVNKRSPQRTEEKSSKRTSPPRKNGPNTSLRRRGGDPEVNERANVTLRLPRIQTAKHKNRKMRNLESGDVKQTIVISDSNVAIKGNQTINRARQRGPTKQRKFLKDLRPRRDILEEETLATLEDVNDYLLNYITTRAYINSKEILNREKFLLIRSKPGDGCSSIGLKLLHDFTRANPPKTPLQVTEVIDFDEAIGGKNTAIFIDDLFNLDMVSLEHKKEWIEKLQRLATALQVKSRNNYVIITMREDAYERLPNFLRDSKLFKSALIDISHEDNNLTFQEKTDFLNRYVLPYAPLSPLQSTELLNVSLPFGFPKCCEIFQDNPLFHKSPFDFFRDPQIFIQGELEVILSEEPCRLAPLALVLLGNGAISEKQLHNIERKGNDALWDKLEEHYENLITCERKQLKYFAHDARKTFLQFDRNTNQFTFSHPSIQRAMACILARVDLKPVIKHCDLSLLPQMRTKSDLCRSKDEVLLDSRCFKTLSKQICKTMANRDKVYFDLLSKMSVWEERKFVLSFANFLKQNTKEEIFSSQDVSSKLLIEYAMQNDKHKSVENMLFVAGKTGKSKCWLDIACENNQRLAIMLLRNNIQPDIETIQCGIKGKNPKILRETLEHVGMNFDRFERRQSKVADNFSSDVTIADEACLSGDIDVVRTVTEYFPELVNSRKEASFLVLIKAAITGGICEIVNRMVDLGVNASSSNQDHSGQNNRVVFCIACKYGETEIAKYFGSEDGTLFTSRDKNNHTPLHSAAIGGTKELAEYLIRGGVDPFAVTVKQATALHLSCASGNLDIVTLLVDNYPTLIEMEDKKEATPVHYATRGGSIEILTLLVERQADIAKVTRKGESILHVSCHRGYIEIAKFITEKCPELSSATTKDGKTALHFACTTDDLDLVKFLVEDLHLNPLQETNAGETSLQMATGYEVKNYLQSVCLSKKPSCNSRIGPNVFESVI